jgi:hypothetical protein
MLGIGEINARRRVWIIGQLVITRNGVFYLKCDLKFLIFWDLRVGTVCGIGRDGCDQGPVVWANPRFARVGWWSRFLDK